jgi:hypothetical protein
MDTDLQAATLGMSDRNPIVNGGAKPGQCGGVKPGHCEPDGFSPGQAPIGAWPGLRVFVLGIMRGGSHRFPG